MEETPSKVRCVFLKDGRDTFSETDWINHVWNGSRKTLFEYCKNSCNDLLYVRAFQRHTGGDTIALELMGHVAIHFTWKGFLFHRGCSFNFEVNLTRRTHRWWKESKEGRQTVVHSSGSLRE